MAILTKLEKYCKGFIDNNYNKKDRKKEDSLKFEWFVNSMHSWHYSSQSYNSKSNIGKEISLGSSLGGDSFFITVGGQLYSLNDDLDSIIEALKKYGKDAKIVFHLLQIKKSNRAKIGEFKSFVEIPLKIFTNIGIEENQPKLVELKKFIKKLIDHEDLKNVKHEFELFFYTEKNENDVEKLRSEWQPEIDFIKKAYAEYTNINIEIRGSEFLNDAYEAFMSNDLKLFISKANLKVVTDDQYLIGFVTAEELLDCIAPTYKGSSDRILKPDVFKNNIRLYLGGTPINKNIEKTLGVEPQKFHLYNNGLTITTKDIDSRNTNNYQISPVNIVNGCQTATSIYNVFKTKSENEKNIKIPVKIIIAQDEEYEKITIRTNSQNGLSEQDLVSISSIQKELEALFQKSKIQNFGYYYKRQNAIDIDVREDIDFIVTINDILRASFTCMMLIPHKVSGYFDSTTGKYIDNIFEERFLKLYFIVSTLLKVTELELEENYSNLHRLKYHITYLVYKLANKGVDIGLIADYFKKKAGNDDLSETILEEQEKLIESIYTNIFFVVKEKENLSKIIKYIVEVLNTDYSALVTIDSKDKEKILYRTVDATQKGERIFSNFEDKFSKTIKDVIKSS